MARTHGYRARFAALLAAFALMAAIGSASLVGAAPDSEDISFGATNEETIVISLDDADAVWGNIGPDGHESNLEGTSYTSTNVGACFEWSTTLTVNSNVAWDGQIKAATFSGQTGIVVGDIDFLEVAPASYGDCTTGQPLALTDYEWETNHIALGTSDHTHYYGLQIDYSDTPGAVTATLTYTVALQV
jgi:hypothetical protein